jgi:hypothetical protein
MARDRSELLGVGRRELKAFRDFHEAYAHEVRESAEHSRTGWDVRAAIAADSLRRAAEAALVLGEDDAMQMVAQAGYAYAYAGLPYGAFLVAAAGGRPPHGTSAALAFVAAGGVERGWWRGRDDEQHSERRSEMPESPFAVDALAHPVQRAYLALAEVMGGAPDLNAVETVTALVADRPHVPAGPFGLPLRTYAAAATGLTAVRVESAADTAAIAALVVESDRRHHLSLDAARSDSPTWTVMFAGGVLVDLDAFACAAALLRWGVRLGAAGETLAGAVARDHLVPPAPEGPPLA